MIKFRETVFARSTIPCGVISGGRNAYLRTPKIVWKEPLVTSSGNYKFTLDKFLKRVGVVDSGGQAKSARNTAWTPTLTWRRGPHRRPTSICGTGPERTDLNWILRSTADGLRNPDPETEVIRFGRVAAFGDCGKNPTGARRSLPPQLIRRQENVFPPMETNLSAATPGNQSLRPTGMLIACDESFRSQRTGARKHRRQGC